MTALLLAAAIASAATTPTVPLSEAAHAIQAGRLDQARIMIGDAIKAGAAGIAVERLLADLAYATGENQAALARYRVLLAREPDDPLMNERAGIAALKLGDAPGALRLLEKATEDESGSWQAWNARGVAADYVRDWATADEAYRRAEALRPGEPMVTNNRGWSLLLRGAWQEALPLLEEAAAKDPKSIRMSHNVELARVAIAQDLPSRHQGESDADWAARLNDAGVLAQVQGDGSRAIAAFTRAIEARSHWYERAARNLAWVESER